MSFYDDGGGRTILHGDCLDMMRAMDDGSFDLVFTSPPYNLGLHPTGKGSGVHAGSHFVSALHGGYEDFDDAMPHEEYDAWQRAVVGECWRLISDDGAIFYNHKQRPMNGGVKLPTIYGDQLPPDALRQVITWDRGVGSNFSQSFYLPKAEWIVVWAKPDWRLATRSACEVGDVWRCAPEGKVKEHPAPFPVALPTRAIETAGERRVLDPFAGSGSTLVAAKAAGVAAVGIEKSDLYCQLAKERLGQGSLLDGL